MQELNGLPKIPPTWSWSTINDACLKVQDGTHFSPQNQLAQGAYKYITAKNVRPSGLDLSNVSYLAEDEHRAIYKRCDPKKGDVLLVKDGVNTGDAAVNTLDEEFSLLSSVCLLRPRPALLYSQFLRYYLLSPVGYRMLTGQMTGTAIKRIILGRIKGSPVPIAPLDEQRDIVAEIEKQFSRLDEAVANLKRVKANLKRYKASVLKSAVEGKLTEDWRKQHPNVEPASKLLERILAERRAKWNGRGQYAEPSAPETTDLASLPKSWKWATVEQLSTVVRGASPRPAGDPRYFGGSIPWITVGPITADKRPYLTAVPETVTEEGKERSRYIEPDTLLLTNSGATLGVPKITIIGGCINDGVAALLDVGQPLKLYLLYFLHTQTAQLRGVNQGAAQPNLNTSIIKAINVPLPPHQEQEQIVEEIELRLSVIDELEAATEANLTRADHLRQSILSQAFSGQLVTAKNSCVS